MPDEDKQKIQPKEEKNRNLLKKSMMKISKK